MKLMNGIKELSSISKLLVLHMKIYRQMHVVSVTNYSPHNFWGPRLIVLVSAFQHVESVDAVVLMGYHREI